MPGKTGPSGPKRALDQDHGRTTDKQSNDARSARTTNMKQYSIRPEGGRYAGRTRELVRSGLPDTQRASTHEVQSMTEKQLYPCKVPTDDSQGVPAVAHVIITTRDSNGKKVVQITGQGFYPDTLAATMAEGTIEAGRQVLAQLKANGHKPCITIERMLTGAPDRVVQYEPGVYIIAYDAPERFSLKGTNEVPAHLFRSRGQDQAMTGLWRAILFGKPREEEPPGWTKIFVTDEGDAPTKPSPVKAYLNETTEAALRQVLKAGRSYTIMADETSATPAIHAMYGKDSVLDLFKMVGTMVKERTLAPEDERLMIGILRGYDKYKPTFGEIDPGELELAWGPSKRFPKSECLQVRARSNHEQRIDVGKDITLINSLRNPGEGPTERSIRHMCHMAIREISYPLRQDSKMSSPLGCATCFHPIKDLVEAQVGVGAGGVPGNYDHIVEVAEIYEQVCQEATTLHLNGQGPIPVKTQPMKWDLPDLRPGMENEALHYRLLPELEEKVKAILVTGCQWLCLDCHETKTKASNRARSKADSDELEESPLVGWWTMHALAVKMGMYADEDGLDGLEVESLDKDEAPTSLWEWMPSFPKTITANTIAISVGLLSSFSAGIMVRGVLPYESYVAGPMMSISPPASPPCSDDEEDEMSDADATPALGVRTVTYEQIREGRFSHVGVQTVNPATMAVANELAAARFLNPRGQHESVKSVSQRHGITDGGTRERATYYSFHIESILKEEELLGCLQAQAHNEAEHEELLGRLNAASKRPEANASTSRAPRVSTEGRTDSSSEWLWDQQHGFTAPWTAGEFEAWTSMPAHHNPEFESTGEAPRPTPAYARYLELYHAKGTAPSADFASNLAASSAPRDKQTEIPCSSSDSEASDEDAEAEPPNPFGTEGNAIYSHCPHQQGLIVGWTKSGAAPSPLPPDISTRPQNPYGSNGEAIYARGFIIDWKQKEHGAQPAAQPAQQTSTAGDSSPNRSGHGDQTGEGWEVSQSATPAMPQLPARGLRYAQVAYPPQPPAHSPYYIPEGLFPGMVRLKTCECEHAKASGEPCGNIHPVGSDDLTQLCRESGPEADLCNCPCDACNPDPVKTWNQETIPPRLRAINAWDPRETAAPETDPESVGNFILDNAQRASDASETKELIRQHSLKLEAHNLAAQLQRREIQRQIQLQRRETPTAELRQDAMRDARGIHCEHQRTMRAYRDESARQRSEQPSYQIMEHGQDEVSEPQFKLHMRRINRHGIEESSDEEQSPAPAKAARVSPTLSLPDRSRTPVHSPERRESPPAGGYCYTRLRYPSPDATPPCSPPGSPPCSPPCSPPASRSPSPPPMVPSSPTPSEAASPTPDSTPVVRSHPTAPIVRPQPTVPTSPMVLPADHETSPDTESGIMSRIHYEFVGATNQILTTVTRFRVQSDGVRTELGSATIGPDEASSPGNVNSENLLQHAVRSMQARLTEAITEQAREKEDREASEAAATKVRVKLEKDGAELASLYHVAQVKLNESTDKNERLKTENRLAKEELHKLTARLDDATAAETRATQRLATAITELEARDIENREAAKAMAEAESRQITLIARSEKARASADSSYRELSSNLLQMIQKEEQFETEKKDLENRIQLGRDEITTSKANEASNEDERNTYITESAKKLLEAKDEVAAHKIDLLSTRRTINDLQEKQAVLVKAIAITSHKQMMSTVEYLSGVITEGVLLDKIKLLVSEKQPMTPATQGESMLSPSDAFSQRVERLERAEVIRNREEEAMRADQATKEKEGADLGTLLMNTMNQKKSSYEPFTTTTYPENADFPVLWELLDDSDKWRNEFAEELDYCLSGEWTLTKLMYEPVLPENLRFVDTILLKRYRTYIASVDPVAMRLTNPDLLNALKVRAIATRSEEGIRQTIRERESVGTTGLPKSAKGKSKARFGTAGTSSFPGPQLQSSDDAGTSGDEDKDTDMNSVTSTVKRRQDEAITGWTNLLHEDKETRDAVYEEYKSSSDQEYVRRVVDAPYDAAGVNLHTRTLFNDELVEGWIRSDGKESRNAWRHSDKCKKLEFPSLLSSPNKEVVKASWVGFRCELIDLIHDALMNGVSWSKVIRYLTQAATRRDTGHAQFQTVFTRAAKDSALLSFAPLHAAVLIYKSDDTFARSDQNYGRGALHSDWDRLVAREVTDDPVSLSARVTDAYVKKLNDPLINANNVFENEQYLQEINEKVHNCLGNDLRYPARGVALALEFRKEWGKLRQSHDRGELSQGLAMLSATRICQIFITVEDEAWKPPNSVAEEPVDPAAGNSTASIVIPGRSAARNPHQGSTARARDGGPLDPDLRAMKATALRNNNQATLAMIESHLEPVKPTYDVNAAMNEQEPNAWRGGGRGKGKGKGRGPYNQEPAGYNNGAWASRGPRKVTAPTGYTEEEFKNSQCEFDQPWFDAAECAKQPKGVQMRAALAKYWPHDASRKAPRLGRADVNNLTRCAYCAFMPLPTPGSPQEATDHPENYLYGTGDGNHSPHGCKAWKRFCLEGGCQDSAEMKQNFKNIVVPK